jgi:diacylglycerol kinase family enzyme
MVGTASEAACDLLRDDLVLIAVGDGVVEEVLKNNPKHMTPFGT